VQDIYVYKDGKIKRLTHMDAWIQYPKVSMEAAVNEHRTINPVSGCDKIVMQW
jgi:hypothetical protein